jgi:hypothetical protein
MGSLGGSDPERTWGDYGNLLPEPAKLKTKPEVRAANDARQQQLQEGMERRSNYARVSTADAEAYKKLQDEGLAPQQIGSPVTSPGMFLLDRILK